MDRPLADGKVDGAHRGEAAELLGQTLGAQNNVSQAGHPVSATDTWPVPFRMRGKLVVGQVC
jgi:hypothetical protein